VAGHVAAARHDLREVDVLVDVDDHDAGLGGLDGALNQVVGRQGRGADGVVALVDHVFHGLQLAGEVVLAVDAEHVALHALFLRPGQDAVAHAGPILVAVGLEQVGDADFAELLGGRGHRQDHHQGENQSQNPLHHDFLLKMCIIDPPAGPASRLWTGDASIPGNASLESLGNSKLRGASRGGRAPFESIQYIKSVCFCQV